MKVSRVGVKFGLSNYLTLTPVVQGQGLLYWKAVGELTHPRVLSFSCSKKRPVCAFLSFGSLPGRHRRRGTCEESYLFFLCFPLSRTPPPMRPLLAMP